MESVDPSVNGGDFAAKRVVGDQVEVTADLISDGHDVVRAALLVQAPARGEPGEAPPVDRLDFLPKGNDRFAGGFAVGMVGRWHFTVEAWVDAFATWRRGFLKKVGVGQAIQLELLEGAALVRGACRRAEASESASADASELAKAVEALEDGSRSPEERTQLAASEELSARCAKYPDTAFATRAGPFPLVVDPVHARFSAWYEMFPRSTGESGAHGTFDTARSWLPAIAKMGFDTLYLPPIHPIGHTFRKGKNNSPEAAPGDVGSPWAIGASTGGHKSVHPDLGGIEQFDGFVAAASEHGLRIALDVALQASPDHPYVREHPQWFRTRPDGTIQYAENPPKKYQDIYPFDFETEDWRSLWSELKSIFEFWIGHGVRTFRVDNPHTKSLTFWHWCITELKSAHPDLVFLAEAFTRPKLMYLLAKAGFTQSYTYFTWRTTAFEIRQYLTELTSSPVKDFFRPNFWPNTPDILPEHLQYAGRPAFAVRVVLAATLSPNYGIYGPAFELMDNEPREGAEEYVDNEKYELKPWPSVELSEGLRPLIRRVNEIRRANPALQQLEGLHFHESDNEMLLCYSKVSADGSNVVLTIVNLDVHHTQSGWMTLDLAKLPLPGDRALQLHDLLSDSRYPAQGRRVYVLLDPQVAPAHIFRVRRHVRTEHDFDYFA